MAAGVSLRLNIITMRQTKAAIASLFTRDTKNLYLSNYLNPEKASDW